MTLLKSILFLLMVALATACSSENSEPSPQVGCATGTALLGMGDHYLVHLCGCQEATGTLVSANETFTCTIASPATIVFQTLSGTSNHQIISTGTPSFVDFPMMNPKAVIPVRSFGLLFSTPGTYAFQDRMNTSLSGQLVVQ